MRTVTALSFGLALLASACSGASDRHEYTLQGQIISIAPDHKDATIKHEDIKGFMSAMTMPYKVREAKEYESLVPGDLINATLVVVSNDAYLKDVKKVGNAPLEKPPAEAAMPPASSGFELLKRHDFAETAQAYARSIMAMARAAGHPEKFHMTITLAMLSAIAERMPDERSDFDTFAEQHPELFDRSFLLNHYTKERLECPLARRTFLLPDCR